MTLSASLGPEERKCISLKVKVVVAAGISFAFVGSSRLSGDGTVAACVFVCRYFKGLAAIFICH